MLSKAHEQFLPTDLYGDSSLQVILSGKKTDQVSLQITITDL